MSKLGTLWTNSIAYVALAVGAGLSIMYNVVDTVQVRGRLFDVFDLITAVAAPGIVVLMVEMFVSRWWIGRAWHMQVVRALSCSVIGGIAMRASWTHGHDFMASRGQAEDVAILWPVAIDLLAIMATALILAGRRGHGHGGDGHVAMASGQLAMASEMAVATEEDVAISEAAFRGQLDVVAMATDELPDWPVDLANFDRDMDLAIQRDGLALAEDVEQYVARAGKGIPDEARILLRAWDGQTHTGTEVDALLAAHFGRSVRTARRWRGAVLGPTSSPPAP